MQKKVTQLQIWFTQILGAMLWLCTIKTGRKDTPILMMSNRSGLQDQNETIRNCFIDYEPSQTWLGLGKSLKNSIPAYAMAALPLVTPVPIQEVQLFDYAVAHKSVNSSYGLTASNDDTFIIDKDPYTSDQQRTRDQYEIDSENWNEVSFEEVNGSSSCKLALHLDWITDHGYVVDGIVNMNLPEQGISGPFKITSIKHIIPQKKPVDEDEADDYEYRLVTGLFVHQTNDVWKITFDDGTELGVTNNHPIYSVSKGDQTVSDEGRKSSDTKSLDSAGTATNRIAASTNVLGVTSNHPIYSVTYNQWRRAADLEIGEEVLAKGGNTKVISKERDLTLQPVYNLEIKDLHNFLVGDVGVVVHNNYIDNLFEIYRDIIGKTGLKHIFHGEIKNGKAYGCHHIRAVKDGKAKLLSNKIEVGPSGSGIYKAKVEVNGVAKLDNDGFSTFFPDDWDELKTMDKIKEAQNNVVEVVTENSGTKVIIGQTSEGVKIKITTYTQFDNNIYTAYPNYD